jgi:CheY-like chemotaxis protein
MGIQGNAALLKMGLGEGDPRSQRLDAISSLVDGGSRLTKQLLGYARAGRYDVAPVDLDEIIDSTLETFAATRRDIRVHLELDGSLPFVEADAGQIEQVLMNLFINAADAMPNGGDLTVSTAVVSRGEVSGSAGELQDSDHVALSVRDTGTGMDELTVERIFEPFFTTKGLHRGTGLGLASVYGIVTSHRGAISVDSEPDVGTTFRIFLPVTDREPQARYTEDGESTPGKGVVLVVDDDAMVLEATTSMLEMLGYEVSGVATGRAAIDAVEHRGPQIDLVILDLVLPDLNGGAVFDALRELQPDLKILLCSGYSLDGDAAGILARGCDGFIQKPFTMQKLAATVSVLVDPGPPAH